MDGVGSPLKAVAAGVSPEHAQNRVCPFELRLWHRLTGLLRSRRRCGFGAIFVVGDGGKRASCRPELDGAIVPFSDCSCLLPRPDGAGGMAERGGPSPAGGSGRTWCLRRVGMSGQWLLLESGSENWTRIPAAVIPVSNIEVTIGRGFGLAYQLVSKTCPLMISRYHCVFKQNAQGQWTVTDNKSLNGVWLNKERLDPLKAYPIGEGDHIQLGVPLDNKETAEYEYEVIKEEWEKVSPFLAPRNDQLMGKPKGARTKRKLSLEESEASGAEGPSNSRSKRDRVSCDSEPLGRSCGRAELAKQPTENMDVKLPSPGPSVEEDKATVYCNPMNSEKAVSLSHKDQKASSLAQSWTGLEMLRKTLGNIMKLKVKVEEKQTAVLSVKKSRKSGQKEIRVMEQELRELQDQLCTEQEHQQQRVEQLERTFYEEQQQLLEGVKKQQGEENLKEQLAQVLQEEEKEKARAQKEEVLSQMNDVLENELQCTICSEHFIEAVTLNCAHSFCSYCINEWMKRKVECPICRREIQSKTRSLVLDNCIDRMVENLNLEMKEHRLALIRERKEKQDVLVNPATDSESSIISSIYSILSMSSYDSDDFEEDSDYDNIYDIYGI
nr:E3 ubiquitin-protein ligase RNF8 isoform X3 [Chrysemys picta bellii]